MKTLFKILALTLFVAKANALNTDLYFDLAEPKFNAFPASNRFVTLQLLTPFPGNLITYTSSASGTFWVSNAHLGNYSGVIKPKGNAGEIRFMVTVTATNLGPINADEITSIGGLQTYPTAGSAAWSIQASDRRYARVGDGGLSYTPQPGSENLTNWSLISTSALQTAAGLGGALTNLDTRGWTNDSSDGLRLNNYGKLVNGRDNEATGVGAHAEGVSTVASGDYAHSEGNSTVAAGAASHADGVLGAVTANWAYLWNGDNADPATNATQGRFQVRAPGGILLEGVITGDGSGLTNVPTPYSAALTNNDTRDITLVGSSFVTQGKVASGLSTTASGTSSHAEGTSTLASGNSSHAEGVSTSASGTASHAEGSATTASASGAHAEGNQTTASGVYSHAEGFQTTAAGYASHADGILGKVSADNAYLWNGDFTSPSTNSVQYSFMVNAPGGIPLLGGVISGNGSGLTNLQASSVTTAVTNAWQNYTLFASNALYALIPSGGTNGGTATNVYFFPGNNTIWRTQNSSNVVDVVGTLTNNSSGTSTWALTAIAVTSSVTNEWRNTVINASNTLWTAIVNSTNDLNVILRATMTNYVAGTSNGLYALIGSSAQTPWTANINAAGFSLTNALTVTSTNYNAWSSIVLNPSPNGTRATINSSGQFITDHYSGGFSGGAGFVGGSATVGSSDDYVAAVGGSANVVTNADNATLIGGRNNRIGLGFWATDYGTIVGGDGNAVYSSSKQILRGTILGGLSNRVSEFDSYALGTLATASNANSFIYNDGSSGAFRTDTTNTFIVRAQNGVGINTNNPGGNALKVVGNVDSTVGFTVNGVSIGTANTGILTNNDTRYWTNTTGITTVDLNASGNLNIGTLNATNFNVLAPWNAALATNLTGDDTVYGASWNGNTNVPTKNAVYDKIETISGGPGGSGTFDYTALTNKPQSVLNVETNNAQSLTNIDFVTGFSATAKTAISNASYTVSTNVNNSLFGFDSDALLYCQQRGISNLSDMFKIDGFVRTRKAGGIWSLVVDTWLLRSNLNSINLTNAISWNGKQHTVFGATAPLYDETGLTFTYNASGALWITNLADMRTNTVIVQAQIDAATWDQIAPVLVIQNGSRFESFTNSYLALGVLQSGNSGVQWRQGISSGYSYASWEDHHRLLGFGLAGSFPSDYPRLYATTVSNTTWQGWFENIPAGPNTLTPVLSTAATPMTSAATGGPLTNMIIGARVTGSGGFSSFGGKVQYISVFSRPLTQQEIECENRALRCLDAQTENWLFYGDSRFAGYSFDLAGAVGDQRGCYVNLLMNQLGNSDVRFYNMAVPSIDMNQQNAASNILRSVAFYAPDGRYVKKTRAFVLASGYNTYSDGDSVLTAFNLASNLCAQIHKMGIEVNLYTEAPIATLNYASNAAALTGWTNFATAYNNMLITNTGMYDRLFRYDLAFENSERTTNSGFYTDGVHPSAAGNRKWAAFTRKEIMGRDEAVDLLRLSQNGSNSISLTFGGSTINGGAITNGIFYGDGSQLTGISGTGIVTNGGTGINNRFTNTVFAGTIGFSNNVTIAGDISVAGTFSVATLNATNMTFAGQSNGVAYIQSDGSVVATNISTGGGLTFDTVSDSPLFFEDFFSKPSGVGVLGTLGFYAAANSGAVNQYTGAADAPGVLVLDTSSSASSAPTIAQITDSRPFIFASGIYTNEWRFKLSSLATVNFTNPYSIKLGWGATSTAAESADAVYVTYSTNDSHFVLVSRKDNTESRVTNTTTVASGSWIKARLVVSNAALATLTINGSDLVSLNSNIPTTGDTVALFSQITKSNGTSVVQLYLDYCKLGYTLNTNR